MITRSELGVQTINAIDCWQSQLTSAITSPKQLLTMLKLDTSLLPATFEASQNFKLKAPLSYVKRIKQGDINDPLLKQILPIDAECLEVEGYGKDPLQEWSQNPTDGVIHKYQGRLLLIVSGACAINCRFCFRRHFPYEDNRLSRDSLQKAIDYIAADTSISEVIFSGGDPLANSDKRLSAIISQLNMIPHLDTLRVHTRLPIMIPERVTDELITLLSTQRLKSVVVLHCNHSNEINEEVQRAIQKMAQVGITLLNQTVLLKGINDSADSLLALNKKLFHASVLPYYLHLLDPVQGAAHFDVKEPKAIEIMQQLSAKSPGYLVPKIVREIAGKPNKTRIL